MGRRAHWLLAAGVAVLAAGCSSDLAWLEPSIPLVESMDSQVAWAHGVEPLGKIQISLMEPCPTRMAKAIKPGLILLSPRLQLMPRSVTLWAVTHELAHLYGTRLDLPWPVSIFRLPLEEVRVELLTGDLLPYLEPAARRVRFGLVRWMVDQVHAARGAQPIKPLRAGSRPLRSLWSSERP